MRQTVLEGIAQAFDHARHQLRGLERLDLGASFDEVTEVPTLDEIHDQVVRPALGGDVGDAHDVGMPQREPQLAFAEELGDNLRALGDKARLPRVGVAVALSQDLQGHNLARLAVYGAVHSGETAGAYGIQHLVGAVEIARPLAFGQAIDLVVGHVLAAEELLSRVFHGCLAAAYSAPHLLELPFGQKIQFECSLQE